VHDQTVAFVKHRAKSRCEYCRLPSCHVALPFEIEHIISKKHEGKEQHQNLAFACLHCNRHKGSNVAGYDIFKGKRKLVKLFNPRLHDWSHHFSWQGSHLIGKTAIGRVTVRILCMNEALMLELREELIKDGLLQNE